MAKIVKANLEVRADRRAARQSHRRSAASWDKTFKVEHIDEGLADHATLSFYRQGEFIDLCRGRHVPSTGAIGAFKLLSRRRRLLERRPIARAVAAALRHRVLQQGRPRPASASGRRGQAPRPPRARQTARVVHHQPARRQRPDSLAAQGRHHPRLARVVRQGRAGPPRLHARLHSQHRPRRAVPDLRPLSLLRRQPVQADRDVGGGEVPPQADELPAPHHDLQEQAAQLSRAAGAAGRVRHRVSLRAIGRARRHDPRSRLHARRRPHLLHRRPGGRRGPRLHRLHADRAARAGARRLSRPARLSRSGQR